MNFSKVCQWSLHPRDASKMTNTRKTNVSFFPVRTKSGSQAKRRLLVTLLL